MAAKAKGVPATLAAIREAQDIKERDVTIPEWGDLVFRVRGLTRGELVRLNDGDPEPETYNIRALTMGSVEPKLSEEEVTEILDTKSMKATQRLMDAIMELSGLSEGFRSES